MPYDLFGEWYDEEQTPIRDRSQDLASAEDVASVYESSGDYLDAKNVDSDAMAELARRYKEGGASAALDYAVNNNIPERSWPAEMRSDPSIQEGGRGSTYSEGYRYVDPELSSLYQQDPEKALQYIKDNEIPKKDWPSQMKDDPRIEIDQSETGYDMFSWAGERGPLQQSPSGALGSFQGSGSIRGTGDDYWYKDPDLLVDPSELSLLGDWDPASLYGQEDRQGAVDRFFDIYENEGITPIERARMDAIRDQAGDWARGQREAQLAQFAQRGMSGSGVNLLANLMAGQDAAEAVQRADLETEAAAQRRALDALMQGERSLQQLSQDVTDVDFKNRDAQLGIDLNNAQTLNQALTQNKQFMQGGATQTFMDNAAWERMIAGLKSDAAGDFMDRDTQFSTLGAGQTEAQNAAEFQGGLASLGQLPEAYSTPVSGQGQTDIKREEDQNAATGETVETAVSSIFGGM